MTLFSPPSFRASGRVRGGCLGNRQHQHQQVHYSQRARSARLSCPGGGQEVPDEVCTPQPTTPGTQSSRVQSAFYLTTPVPRATTTSTPLQSSRVQSTFYLTTPVPRATTTSTPFQSSRVQFTSTSLHSSTFQSTTSRTPVQSNLTQWMPHVKCMSLCGEINSPWPLRC